VQVIVRAAGRQPIRTHVFADSSAYLDSDIVFAVKPSLLRKLVAHPAHDPAAGSDRG
jgi:hydroxyquinol 1,2-dioxygenase